VAQIVYILALVACSLYHCSVVLLTVIVYSIKHRPSLATAPFAGMTGSFAGMTGSFAGMTNAVSATGTK